MGAMAPRNCPAAEILKVLFITALGLLCLYDRAVAADLSPATTAISSNTVSQAEQGPERLKSEVRITVETNAAPATAATNAVSPKDKSFQWKFTWDGWNGLQTEISQQTRIKDPFADLRTKVEGTNTYRVLHLEEMKMGGNIGGRLAVDGAAYVTSQDFQGFDAGIELRRARIYAKGDCLLLLPVSYEIQLGYVPNQFSLQDTYIQFSNLGFLGSLKVGDYQPPMSLDAITSSRDITFMELAAPVQALAPGMGTGAQIGRPVFHERMTWAFGLFSEGVGNDYGDASQNFARAITRLTCLPVYHADPDQPGSAQLLHLGLSANILYSGNSTVHYRSRPQSYQAPYVIDTGDIAAEGAFVAGAEVAWVNGPFSVQGEFLNSWVRENNGQTPDFYGLYATASWFLTGESRPYDRTTGAFARVIPKRNFDFGHGGWGAWEIAGRYSYANLDSADVNGGRLRMIMAGVNWYLHSHLKWRFEYGFGHVTDRQPSGNMNIFQTRIEADF
jgi:phosphate-selective porin OprO and OprP